MSRRASSRSTCKFFSESSATVLLSSSLKNTTRFVNANSASSIKVREASFLSFSILVAAFLSIFMTVINSFSDLKPKKDKNKMAGLSGFENFWFARGAVSISARISSHAMFFAYSLRESTRRSASFSVSTASSFEAGGALNSFLTSLFDCLALTTVPLPTLYSSCEGMAACSFPGRKASEIPSASSDRRSRARLLFGSVDMETRGRRHR
mmetsp:Transcript_29138/g.93698  ORF Transcript_29138/g.93698 Transcript_29138/m.93698 type:complete len:209 (+) Transcript_29138:739-1365(+)